MITTGLDSKFNYGSRTAYLRRTLEEMQNDQSNNYIFVGCDPDTMEPGTLYKVEVDWPTCQPIVNKEPCSSGTYYEVVRRFEKVPQNIINAEQAVNNYWRASWQEKA